MLKAEPVRNLCLVFFTILLLLINGCASEGGSNEDEDQSRWACKITLDVTNLNRYLDQNRKLYWIYATAFFVDHDNNETFNTVESDGNWINLNTYRINYDVIFKDANGSASLVFTVRRSYYPNSEEWDSVYFPINDFQSTAHIVLEPTFPAMRYGFEGYIDDINGNAIKGVEVSIAGPENDQYTTPSNGYYIFEWLPEGTYTATPFKSGYAFTPLDRQITISGSNLIDINFIGQ